jgi:hypothetical protein
VIAAIRKIERLRTKDETVDALIEMLTATLSSETSPRSNEPAKSKWQHLIIDAVSERVIGKLTDSPPRKSRRLDQQSRDPAHPVFAR